MASAMGLGLQLTDGASQLWSTSERMKNPTPKAIKKARLAAGLTQQQAAELIGYSRRAWQEWEAGRRTMRRVTLDAFQRVVVSNGTELTGTP